MKTKLGWLAAAALVLMGAGYSAVPFSFSGLTSGGIMYANSTTTATSTGAGAAGQALVSGGAGVPTWSAIPNTVFVASNRTITSATAATTTDLTWNIDASKSQRFICNLVHSTNSSASGTRFAVATSQVPIRLACLYTYVSTSLTATSGAQVQGAWGSTCTNCTPANTASNLTTVISSTLDCIVVGNVLAGTVTIYFACSNGANTSTLYAGSSCTYASN